MSLSPTAAINNVSKLIPKVRDIVRLQRECAFSNSGNNAETLLNQIIEAKNLLLTLIKYIFHYNYKNT